MTLTAYVLLAGEFLIASLLGAKPSRVYDILPITSLSHHGKPLLQSLVVNPIARKMGREIKPAEKALREEITIYLKNGNQVTGGLVSQEGDWITLDISGSKAGFHHSEISRIVRSKKETSGKTTP